jgi:hypothetical protein
MVDDTRLGLNQCVLREGRRTGERCSDQGDGRLRAPGHGQTRRLSAQAAVIVTGRHGVLRGRVMTPVLGRDARPGQDRRTRGRDQQHRDQPRPAGLAAHWHRFTYVHDRQFSQSPPTHNAALVTPW